MLRDTPNSEQPSAKQQELGVCGFRADTSFDPNSEPQKSGKLGNALKQGWHREPTKYIQK